MHISNYFLSKYISITFIYYIILLIMSLIKVKSACVNEFYFCKKYDMIAINKYLIKQYLSTNTEIDFKITLKENS